MAVQSIRAFSDPGFNYYRLTKDFGCLKAGAVFFHDPDDSIYGSPAHGCLKLCWTPNGDCYDKLCGGTIALHANFIESNWFEKVDRTVANAINNLNPGYYGVEVHADGTWTIQQFGAKPW